MHASKVKITDDIVESAFHLYCAGGKNASSMKDALEDYEAHRLKTFTLEQVIDAMDNAGFSISEIEGVINRLTPSPPQARLAAAQKAPSPRYLGDSNGLMIFDDSPLISAQKAKGE